MGQGLQFIDGKGLLQRYCERCWLMYLTDLEVDFERHRDKSGGNRQTPPSGQLPAAPADVSDSGGTGASGGKVE